MLIFLRFLSAACAGTTAASQIMIARTTPNEKQGFAQGVLSTAIWGGAMLGNVIGGFIIHYYSYLHAFWFCGILYFLAGISVLFTKDSPKRQEAQTPASCGGPALGVQARNAIMLLAFLFFLMGIIRNYETPYIALRIENITGEETAEYWTGIVSAIVCMGAILSGFATGYLTDRVRQNLLIVPIFITCALALVMQAYGGLATLTAGRTLMYFAAGGIPPILQKTLSDVTPQHKRGGAFGVSSCLLNLGAMAASLMAGFSMKRYGIEGVFLACAIMYLALLPVFTTGISKAMAMVRRTG